MIGICVSIKLLSSMFVFVCAKLRNNSFSVVNVILFGKIKFFLNGYLTHWNDCNICIRYYQTGIVKYDFDVWFIVLFCIFIIFEILSKIAERKEFWYLGHFIKLRNFEELERIAWDMAFAFVLFCFIFGLYLAGLIFCGHFRALRNMEKLICFEHKGSEFFLHILWALRAK